MSKGDSWQYPCVPTKGGGFTLYLIIWILLWLPLLLLAVAWSRAKAQYVPLTLLTLSAILLLSSGVRSVKLLLLGANYSHRLYTTLELNFFLAVILGLYMAIRKRWVATVAAIFLGLAWVYLMVVNSVV